MSEQVTKFSLESPKLQSLIEKASRSPKIAPAAAPSAPVPEGPAIPESAAIQPGDVEELLINGHLVRLPKKTVQIASDVEDIQSQRKVPAPSENKTVDFNSLPKEMQDQILTTVGQGTQPQGAWSTQATPSNVPTVQFEVEDRGSPSSPPPANEPTPAPAAPAAPALTPAGGLPAPLLCPRCGWDCNQADHVKPTPEDIEYFKLAFYLGQSFKKTMKAGDMHVEFRQLSVAELDAIWAQVLYDARGKYLSREEGHEQFMKYRLCLSLCSIRVTTDNANITKFPGGLSPLTSLDEVDTYYTESDFKALPDRLLGNSGLKEIAQQLDKKIFRTEARFRILQNLNFEFNRLAAKMEVLVQTENF